MSDENSLGGPGSDARTGPGKFIFVLGPHRSGTSMLAAIASALGVDMGSNFIAASDENPKGFFEDGDVVELNDRILRRMRLSWDCVGFLWQEDFNDRIYAPYRRRATQLLRQKFSHVAVAGLKDPRLCVLLPFWKSVILETFCCEIYYLLSVRDPMECVASQKVRHDRDPDFHLLGRRGVHTLMLWSTYVYKALVSADSDRLLCVSYERVLADPAPQVARIGSFLDIGAPADVDAAVSSGLVDTQLHRSRPLDRFLHNHYPDQYNLAYRFHAAALGWANQDAVSSADVSELLAMQSVSGMYDSYLEEVQRMYGFAYKKNISLRHRLIMVIQELSSARQNEGEVRAHLHDLQSEHQALLDRHNEILGSKAWRAVVLIRKLLFRQRGRA